MESVYKVERLRLLIISVLLDITEQSETGEEDTLAPVLVLGPHLLV